MIPIFQKAKKAVRKILPYTPKKGVVSLQVDKYGKGQDGVTCTRVFPASSFSFKEYKSLKGESDFKPYEAQIPEYKIFCLENGKFIFGREEVFSRSGKIIEEISAQKINPLVGKKLDLSAQKKIKGTVLLLGLSGLEDAYYHFIIEFMLRWWIFKQSGLQADFYAFSTKQNFQKEAIALLGIKESQILQIDGGTVVQADKVICPSLVNNFELSHLRGYEIYNKVYMPSWSRDVYSYILEANRLKNANNERLIYISRNHSSRRRIDNEEGLLQILKKYGFEIYYLEGMTLREQIKLFSSARMVVAPHGAGLVNLVWSKEGTIVLELYPQFYHDPSYRILSSVLGHEYHYAICKSPDAEHSAPVDENIYIDDLDLIEKFLKEKLAV